jgi:hypothetical protein
VGKFFSGLLSVTNLLVDQIMATMEQVGGFILIFSSKPSERWRTRIIPTDSIDVA